MKPTEQELIHHQDTILDIARQSIRHGLEHHQPLPVDINDYPEELQGNAATFITLHIDGQLRGCIGTLESRQPLIRDVAENAYNAAFLDPRFPPLTHDEYQAIDIHISVLTEPEPLPFTSKTNLVETIQPGKDGLILRYNERRGTFLPSVWESLPDPRDFLRHLVMKAGLPDGFWDDHIHIWRYHTISLPAKAGEHKSL